MNDLADTASLKREVAGLLEEKFTPDGLARLKVEWLGKEGRIKALFRALQSVPAEKKPEAAKDLNELRETLEQFISIREQAFAKAKRDEELSKESMDLSVPSRRAGFGKLHPATRCERAILQVVRQYGFKTVLGPEIEKEFYNFDALNFPAHHPSRDLMDTFYTDTGHVLRTHVTSLTSRALETETVPIKVVSLGRVYRNEAEDASHLAMFHQFELVWVDEGLTLAHLMGLMSHILKEIYGKRRKIRFVPKYYPYTEPSIGPQIDCGFCRSHGCESCGGAGWVTVAGSGLLHRNVLNTFNIDPEKYVALAFGMGTSRLAAQMIQSNDIRSPYENDIKQLRNAR